MFNVPMDEALPFNLPLLTVPAMCALTVIKQQSGQNKLTTALDALRERGRGARIMEAAGTDWVEQALKNNVKAVFDEETFGLPWMVRTRPNGENETFWGVDHLAVVAGFLGLEKPIVGV
ncbi:glutathione S-transferase kappa 1 [Geosmithia morbida]|uniref:Glutathione S-transferase kappa 1 n=1 Tax=Geosmithia morbida TaxID=1094350 RepID=A0A9P4YSM9_9HYPO|nr:glutathione S-transferase kappa 1 [Geosmithia morbida]KAF4120988.1 glutathione S-transferase kappa 1 [Geosmithia morbida]